jgi:ribosome-associated translation inhibitor RaiA
VFWSSDVSRGAHTECYKEIELFDNELEKEISKLFPKNSEHHKRNEAHSKAVRTMEEIP